VSANSFTGHQGILQLIPSFVYFGQGNVLGYYGYISEWSYEITHFTQKMIPMRCIIDVSWTMLPYTPSTSGNPRATSSRTPPDAFPGHELPGGIASAGVSGR
jgi:hypothetical protein